MAEAVASIQPSILCAELCKLVQKNERQMQLVQRGCDHKVVSTKSDRTGGQSGRQL
jgi:hypothetical protein